ncbi:cyclodeaminase [Pseudoponticoccus marisrubri]|uniref:Ectoine utilization protein EutC n=1 Tax=Pseudoponticoccus marisrubri TaxID=1685382 RepID=A0A0W7WNZ8_9RHOB|nr:cyclodeaminase [Pseudoponticoccus marisrubri]KUF12322.1 ectoine utilization protein EutC [Pseudoponticoccus marisrubri]
MGHDIRIVTEAQLREIVALDRDLVDVIERGFVALAAGEVVMPPILSMDLPQVNGEVDVKTAWMPGVEGFAIKVSPGFFDNPALGLASLNGLMVLLSARTGLVQAVFLDNGYLTDIRTAAAGAVAARHLAPATVETAGVLGTGVQARLQMQAAHLERPFRRVLVWGRDAARAQACARDLAETLGIEAQVAATPEAVVRDSQLVVTTTPSRTPLVQADWLHDELLVTAMGADQAGKTEIAPAALEAAGLYVCDRVSQARVSGELEGALAAGLMQDVVPPELGALIGAMPAPRPGCIICDLTGTGVQDTAIATHVHARLGDAGSVIAV